MGKRCKGDGALIQFIKAKAEKSGKFINIMGLHCEPDKINIEELKELCGGAAAVISDECMFYYLVVFDSEENAVFPETPFTAIYGDEEEPQRHIKAIYEYNKHNGYSVLSLYEKNKWESPVEEIKIYGLIQMQAEHE